jgi:hypothetical protein
MDFSKFFIDRPIFAAVLSIVILVGGLITYVAAAAEASATAARLARTRYEGGYVDFLEVLDAERTQLETEDRLAHSRTETATSLIAVYKALGGGWEQAPLPRYTRTRGSR